MTDLERKISPDDAGRKRMKTAEDSSLDEAHAIGEGAPKLPELGSNGGAGSDATQDNNAMAVDNAKTSSKANGADGSQGDKEEDKQDLKSIEDEFTQLKEKYFSDKLAAVKTEIEQLEQGTHDGLKTETKSLESKKLRRIALAEQIYKHQLDSVYLAYMADVKCAEDEYIAEAKELRDKTLKNLHKKKKDLEEEKRDFSLADSGPGGDAARASTRTLRKRGQLVKDSLPESSAPTPAPGAEQPKKVPELKVKLSDEEMESDMALIQRGINNL